MTDRKMVIVERRRIQTQRAVFEVDDDSVDAMKDAAIRLYQRAAEDPFTGRTEWVYKAGIIRG